MSGVGFLNPGGSCIWSGAINGKSPIGNAIATGPPMGCNLPLTLPNTTTQGGGGGGGPVVTQSISSGVAAGLAVVGGAAGAAATQPITLNGSTVAIGGIPNGAASVVNVTGNTTVTGTFLSTGDLVSQGGIRATNVATLGGGVKTDSVTNNTGADLGLVSAGNVNVSGQLVVSPLAAGTASVKAGDGSVLSLSGGAGNLQIQLASDTFVSAGKSLNTAAINNANGMTLTAAAGNITLTPSAGYVTTGSRDIVIKGNIYGPDNTVFNTGSVGTAELTGAYVIDATAGTAGAPTTVNLVAPTEGQGSSTVEFMIFGVLNSGVVINMPSPVAASVYGVSINTVAAATVANATINAAAGITKKLTFAFTNTVGGQSSHYVRITWAGAGLAFIVYSAGAATCVAS